MVVWECLENCFKAVSVFAITFGNASAAEIAQFTFKFGGYSFKQCLFQYFDICSGAMPLP